MLYVYVDGAVLRTNPGLASWGVFVESPNWLAQFSGPVGYVTNNVAELVALEKGLIFLIATSVNTQEALIFTDSLYAKNLIQCVYKPRKNLDLVNRLLRLYSFFPVAIEHISGSVNKAHEVAQKQKFLL